MSFALKNRGKVVMMFLTIIVTGLILMSCTTGQRCAAYGERNRYQVERH